MSSTESTETLVQRIRAASDLPARVATALARGRSRAAARMHMSPELSYGRHAGPAPYTARHAAVIALLFRRSGIWHIPLTERQATLSKHAGQISLPGGATDDDESSSQTALRELAEELGIFADVRMLGRLADCYVYASDFLVTPWVAMTTDDPIWTPHDQEVKSVIELPIETLLSETVVETTTISRGPVAFRAPCINVGTACIWGATSVILGELAGVLREAN